MSKSVFDNYFWIPFRNDSGETIPPYSSIKITGVVSGGARTTLTAEKPDADATMFATTGPFSVSSGGFGSACVSVHRVAAFTGSLSVGQRCKPKVGEWKLELDLSGPFVCLGVIDSTNNLALVIQDQIASGGSRLIKAPSGGIPGRVGTLLGTADCEIVSFDTAGQITVTSETIAVLNWAKFPACKNGDRYGVASWVNTAWLIVAEDCSDTGSETGPQSMSINTGSVSDLIDFTDTTPSTVYIRNMLVGGTTPTGGTGGGIE